MAINNKKIRVLIVDDSALVRDILKKGLASDPDIEVIGTASDPYHARDILVTERPDVITLDVEMPRMDGVSFLKKYMQVIPTPTIMVSSLTERGKLITIEALESGAVDVVTKPKSGISDNLPRMIDELCKKIKSAALVDVTRQSKKISPIQAPISTYQKQALDETTDQVIALGTSTGGTEALARILPIFPPTTPGIVVVQHMPADFTLSLAKRLNTLSAMEVREAKDGDRILSGVVLIAPGGDNHMEVERYGGQYRARLIPGDLISNHRPSVDALFHSVGRQVGNNSIAVLMTGMGKDGAEGLLAIKNAGGKTFVQDEKTSVVFGMPKAGWDLGAAKAMIPLSDIPKTIASMI